MQWHEIYARRGGTGTREQRAAGGDGRLAVPVALHRLRDGAPALPFHVGHRPYQPILFQFSHHLVERDGSTRHADECLIVDGEASPSIGGGASPSGRDRFG